MPHTRCPRPSIAVALGALAVFPAFAAAQTIAPRLLFDVEGSASSMSVGQCLSRAGDLNGDGYPDFALGIPAFGPLVSDSTGRVLIYFGGRRLHSIPDLVLEGEQRGSRFGSVVEAAGDVNGDGYDDLLVTAPRYQFLTGNRSGSGRAYLYTGAHAPTPGPATVYDAPISDYATNRNDGFGVAACGLGDVDGDGYGDLAIVSENTWRGPGGAIEIFRGGRRPAPAPFHSLGNPGWGCISVCGPGDVTGDGFADLMAASTDVFNTRHPLCLLVVYTGLRTQSLEGLTVGASPRPGFGTHLAVVDDINKDGRRDVVVGHPYSTGGGAAYVYFGGAGSLVTLRPPSPLPDSFGTSIASGDVDGDGTSEILVGAPGSRESGPGAGAVYIYRGFTALPVGRWTGAPGDYFGFSLTIPGDLDRNGAHEMLVGSPRRDGLAARTGRAELLTLTSHVLVEPETAAEWRAGGEARVRWLGPAPARISLSLVVLR